jgi:hypothetical protein
MVTVVYIYWITDVSGDSSLYLLNVSGSYFDSNLDFIE